MFPTERTNRVHNYTIDACGTDHFTMGDGGNIEGLRAVYVTSADGVVNGVGPRGFLAISYSFKGCRGFVPASRIVQPAAQRKGTSAHCLSHV